MQHEPSCFWGRFVNDSADNALAEEKERELQRAACEVIRRRMEADFEGAARLEKAIEAAKKKSLKD